MKDEEGGLQKAESTYWSLSIFLSLLTKYFAKIGKIGSLWKAERRVWMKDEEGGLQKAESTYWSLSIFLSLLTKYFAKIAAPLKNFGFVDQCQHFLRVDDSEAVIPGDRNTSLFWNEAETTLGNSADVRFFVCVAIDGACDFDHFHEEAFL